MSADKKSLAGVFGVAAVLIALQAISGFVLYHVLPDWQVRGQFGDMFGAVNTLFSGLALVGLVYAILLQRQDLELQRRELELTREELRRSAQAQEKSEEALRAQVEAARSASYSQNIISLIDYIQRTDNRAARSHLFGIENFSFHSWSESDKRQAEIVCSTWDSVALILNTSGNSRSITEIVKYWRHSIWRSHKCTEDLRRAVRAERNPEMWLGFDWLAQQATQGYVVVDGALQRAQHNEA